MSKSKITKFLVRQETNEGIYLLYDRIDLDEFKTVCKALKEQDETMYVAKQFSKNNSRFNNARNARITIEIGLLKKISHVSCSLAPTHDLKLTSFLEAYCQIRRRYRRRRWPHIGDGIHGREQLEASQWVTKDHLKRNENDSSSNFDSSPILAQRSKDHLSRHQVDKHSIALSNPKYFHQIMRFRSSYQKVAFEDSLRNDNVRGDEDVQL